MEKSSPPPPPAAAAKPNSLLHRLITLDTTSSLHLHQIAQPIPRSLLKLLELSGDGRFWLPIPISLLLTLSSRSTHLRTLLTGLILGTLLDLLLVGLLKFTIRRPRPIYNKGMHLTVAVDHWSFPSGHSSRVCFIASFLLASMESIAAATAQLGIGGGKGVRYAVYFVCLWSILTSLSRVLLGRHFVFDVVAGACLGVVEAYIVLSFL